jgi:myo-inositol-1(or 4)-monophosphatase
VTASESHDLGPLLAFARETLALAGVPVLEHFRRDVAVEDKGDDGDYDPVTIADREAEAIIRARIRDAYPDHGIVGEEAEDERPDARSCWTIDPIDGTRGFVSGFVQWGMLLALSVDHLPILGVVHQPFTGETWSGSPSGALFHRGDETRALRVRACPDLASAVLASTDPFYFPERDAHAFHSLRRSVRLGRYGGDCYAYCMLAMGQLDLVVETGLSPWDVRALIPVVEGAGGFITNWRGGDCSDGGQVLASGDERVHALALERLAPAAEGPAA